MILPSVAEVCFKFVILLSSPVHCQLILTNLDFASQGLCHDFEIWGPRVAKIGAKAFFLLLQL